MNLSIVLFLLRLFGRVLLVGQDLVIECQAVFLLIMLRLLLRGISVWPVDTKVLRVDVLVVDS